MAAPHAVHPISTGDLAIIAGEPRVRDTLVAERLGCDPRGIRKLIEQNEREFALYAPLFRALWKSNDGLIEETWLNEDQALLACTLFETPMAAAVRRVLIRVFIEWRSATAARVAALGWAPGRANEVSDMALALTHMPIWFNARRPRFWADLEVRLYLLWAHRQMPIAAVRTGCLERYGVCRTPSRSEIGRFFTDLDQLYGAA